MYNYTYGVCVLVYMYLQSFRYFNLWSNTQGFQSFKQDNEIQQSILLRIKDWFLKHKINGNTYIWYWFVQW